MVICDDADVTHEFDQGAAYLGCSLFNDSYIQGSIKDAFDMHYPDSISKFSSDFESESDCRSISPPWMASWAGFATSPCEHTSASACRGTGAKPANMGKKAPRGRHRIVHDRKASLNAGMIASARKSCGDVEDVVVQTDDDEITLKRKRNTVAARRSRARKQETLAAMSTEIKRLRGMLVALGADPDKKDVFVNRSNLIDMSLK